MFFLAVRIFIAFKIIGEREGLLQRPEPQVAGLGELRVLLVVWLSLPPIIEEGIFVHYVLLIYQGYFVIRPMPSFHHLLSVAHHCIAFEKAVVVVGVVRGAVSLLLARLKFS